jgi:hypothetical protein
LNRAADAFEGAVRSAHRRAILTAAAVPGLVVLYFLGHVVVAWWRGGL